MQKGNKIIFIRGCLQISLYAKGGFQKMCKEGRLCNHGDSIFIGYMLINPHTAEVREVLSTQYNINSHVCDDYEYVLSKNTIVVCCLNSNIFQIYDYLVILSEHAGGCLT